MPLSTYIHDRLRSLAPIAGVSIGRVDDPATWRLDFTADATDAQRAAAVAAMTAMSVLDWRRSEAVAVVQAAADAFYRTVAPTPELAFRHMSKIEDVTAWATLQDAGAGDRLQKEADARGMTREALAAAIVAKREALKELSAGIETVRAAAKRAIAAAATAEEIASIAAETVAAIEKSGGPE